MEEHRRRRKTSKKKQEKKKKDSGVTVAFQLCGLYSHLEFLMSNRFETGHLPYGEKRTYTTLSSGHQTAQGCFVAIFLNPANVTVVSYNFSRGYQ